MKLFFGTVGLALMLMLSPVRAQQKSESQPVEYNIGVCGAGQFFGLHMSIQQGKMSVLRVSMGPGKNQELPHPVEYAEGKPDADGTRHFVLTDEGDTFDVALKFDNDHVDGILIVDGKKAAKIFGVVGDGKILAEQSEIYFQECAHMQDGQTDSEATN